MDAVENDRPSLALHTAARRYLMRRANDAHRQSMYARAQLLRDVLVEVERLDPRTLPDLPQLRAHLSSVTIAKDASEERSAAAEAELPAFRRLVRSLSDRELRSVSPLPWRRALTSAERERVESDFRTAWGVGPWPPFWPLDCQPHRPVEVYRHVWFHRVLSFSTIRRLLESRGVQRVLAFREYGDPPVYELCLNLVRPRYDMDGEGVWTSEGFDWLIYASHERTVTVGGFMLDQTNAAPGAARGRWTSFDD